MNAMETTTTLVDNITSKISQLSPLKLYEILDFVEYLTWQETHNLNESQELSDRLIDQLGTITEGIPLLSDYAVSREGIYEEHL
jgi:hypothetical protein